MREFAFGRGDRGLRIGNTGDGRLAQRILGDRTDHGRGGALRGPLPLISDEQSKLRVHVR